MGLLPLIRARMVPGDTITSTKAGRSPMHVHTRVWSLGETLGSRMLCLLSRRHTGVVVLKGLGTATASHLLL